jgi:hypothetical protein
MVTNLLGTKEGFYSMPDKIQFNVRLGSSLPVAATGKFR